MREGWLRRRVDDPAIYAELLKDIRRQKEWSIEELGDALGQPDKTRVSNLLNRGTAFNAFETRGVEAILENEKDPANQAFFRTRHPRLLRGLYPQEGAVQRLLARIFEGKERDACAPRAECTGENGRYLAMRMDAAGRLLVSCLLIGAPPSRDLPAPFLMMRPKSPFGGTRITRGVMFQLGDHAHMIGRPTRMPSLRHARLCYQPRSACTDLHGLRIAQMNGRPIAYRVYLYQMSSPRTRAELRAIVREHDATEFDALRGVVRNLDEIVALLRDKECDGNGLLGAPHD